MARAVGASVSALCLFAAACTCNVSSPPGPYACMTDRDCEKGFFCDEGVCAAVGTTHDAGAPDSGAGGSGGGSPDLDGGPVESVLAFGATDGLAAGFCSSRLSVLVQPVVAHQPHIIALAAAPTGLTFYADPQCATPITTVTVDTGQGSADFYARTLTGQTYQLTGTSPGLLTATATAIVLPIVRRGTCLLGTGVTSIGCDVAPPQLDVADTWLVFQASGTTVDDVSSTSTRCVLVAPSQLRCERQNAAGEVSIAWQTAELPGLNVQRAEAQCNGTTSQVMTFAAPSDFDSSFLLVGERHTGAGFSSNDAFAASLRAGAATDPAVVDLTWATACDEDATLSGELVQWPGIHVTRGTSFMDAGQSAIESDPLAAASQGSSFVLSTWTTAADFADESCNTMLRSSLASDTTIGFSRGDAVDCVKFALPTITFQRVELGAHARVEAVDVSMDADAGSTVVAVTPTDLTRTLVFSGSQTANQGQALGEGLQEIPRTPSDFAALFVLDAGDVLTAGEVWASRRSTLAPSRWTAFVLELKP